MRNKMAFIVCAYYTSLGEMLVYFEARATSVCKYIEGLCQALPLSEAVVWSVWPMLVHFSGKGYLSIDSNFPTVGEMPNECLSTQVGRSKELLEAW